MSATVCVSLFGKHACKCFGLLFNWPDTSVECSLVSVLVKTLKVWHVCLFSSEQRILLISNPLQNTLKELWTMIHFLLPGITRPFSDFPVKASTDQNQDYCHKLVIRLHRVGAASSQGTASFHGVQIFWTKLARLIFISGDFFRFNISFSPLSFAEFAGARLVLACQWKRFHPLHTAS